MDGGFREWLSRLSRREAALLALLGLLGVAGVGLWYVRAQPHPVEVRVAGPVAAPSASPSPQLLVVHVAGWVRRPGVYELRQGDRVIDAIEAAGGPRKGADLGALNLAALLVDAQQVLVPRVAVAAPGPVSGSTGETPTSGVPQLVNVNIATAEDLETLPGIGEVLAAAIVAYREEHGPFTSVDQLEDVSGIGPVTLDELRDLITV
jgi:competence protein ComEA